MILTDFNSSYSLLRIEEINKGPLIGEVESLKANLTCLDCEYFSSGKVPELLLGEMNKAFKIQST